MWDFINTQILGMKWLSILISKLLSALGVDTDSRIGGSIQFFFYDVIKISIFLCLLIFVISYIQSFFPPERSRKLMGKFRGIGANIVGALLGTVTPFCSCSSIPIFMGFTSAGLPLGVTFSFLISSPMVDLGSLVLLMSIFGVRIAIVYVVMGLMIAVVGGSLIEKLHMEDQIADFIRNANSSVDIETPSLTVKERLIYAKDQVVSTVKKVFPYILIGVGIGAVIHNWIPESWVRTVLGGINPFGVILATILGIPMYADIFGVVPIAEALLSKGALLGTILSFMMAVTTLSLPSLIMLKKAIKTKLLGIFIAICTVGIIIVGYGFNVFQYLFI
ncbi:MAG: permease [Butyrivibrio sp.]|uniref:permease n=1 Tax=Butyrivibrio sp. TaxID=28121 RepID=UPI001B0F901F|nr:permease [Butyrivibrio sp.]MBO6239508.1 permease [Butyrivibrio sp.]